MDFLNLLIKKRIERIEIIKKLCKNGKKIHVYGNGDWKEHIPSENYIGKIPNENESGLRGNFDLKEKIKNKCMLLSQYKFVLVFENLFVDGFVTEKLVESLYSDSVAVYYGPKNIKNMYHNLFIQGVINGHDYNCENSIKMMNNMDSIEYNNRVDKIQLTREKLNYDNSSENTKIYVISKIKEEINKT